MAAVRIDSGPVAAEHQFAITARSKWTELMRAKSHFLKSSINYDCRCLVQFCGEARDVWDAPEFAAYGFTSAEDMIRRGYELEPVEIELAVAWLKHNEPDAAIGLDAVKQKVAEARERPLAEHGEIGNGRVNESRPNNIRSTQYGTGTNYTLRRLARDAPEMLDRIESGELSVNAAAIEAGIRKRPSPAEQCVRAFLRADNRVEVAKSILLELTPNERQALLKQIKR